MAFDEEVVDGAVNGIGRAHASVSRGLHKLQSGFVYNYALAIVIGLVILISLAVTIFS